MPGGQKQTFLEHLKELRRRLLWPVLSIAIFSTAAFMLNKQIVGLLQAPLNKTLYYSSPVGGFSFVFQIAVFTGLLFSLPVFMHQLVRFIEPIMSKVARRTMVMFMVATVGLAGLGVLCGYLISLPAALHFLNTFESSTVQALISADQYLKFVTIYLAGYAVLFQIPLVTLLINRIKPLTPGGMMRYQKHMLVASAVAAGILTPTPDAYNQIIFALPLIVLYQVSIMSVWVVNRKLRPALVKTGPQVRSSYEVEDLEAIPLALAPASVTPALSIATQPTPQPATSTSGFDIVRPQTA